MLASTLCAAGIGRCGVYLYYWSNGLQLIVPKYCSPTTVSYDERDENHRESSLGG